MITLNSHNRINAIYNRFRNRKSSNLLNSAEPVQSNQQRQDKKDRRQLADRRQKYIPVLQDRRKGRDRRQGRTTDFIREDASNSIDTTA